MASFAISVPLTYVLVHALHVPMLWLDPETLKWSVGARPSPLAMDFYGRSLASLVVGAASFGVAALIAARIRTSSLLLRASAALVVLALLGALSYETVRLTAAHAQSAPALLASDSSR